NARRSGASIGVALKVEITCSSSVACITLAHSRHQPGPLRLFGARPSICADWFHGKIFDQIAVVSARLYQVPHKAGPVGRPARRRRHAKLFHTSLPFARSWTHRIDWGCTSTLSVAPRPDC